MVRLKTLEAFYETIEADTRIGAVHISLYVALLYVCEKSGGCNPFDVVRREMMRVAKISARSTYDICIHQLKDFGYIGYEPSNGSAVKSKILLKKL